MFLLSSRLLWFWFLNGRGRKGRGFWTLCVHMCLWEGTVCFFSLITRTESEKAVLGGQGMHARPVQAGPRASQRTKGIAVSRGTVSPRSKAVEVCEDNCVLVQKVFRRPNTVLLMSWPARNLQRRQIIKARENSVGKTWTVLVFLSSWPPSTSSKQICLVSSKQS